MTVSPVDIDRLREKVKEATAILADRAEDGGLPNVSADDFRADILGEFDVLAAEVVALRAERDEAEGKYVAEIVRHTRTEGRVAELEAALRFTEQAMEEVLELEEPAAEIADVATSAARAVLDVLRRALGCASDTPCEACGGIGAQAGSHTERVSDCPICGGTGCKKAQVEG